MAKSRDIEVVETELQIKEELDAHRKGWTAQAIGLVLMYALIAAAAVGLFGDGLASRQTKSAQQVTVESEQFYRFQAVMPLKITAANISGDELTISFPNDYIKHFEVRSIVPEPTSTEFTDDKVQYTFEATGKADVTFYCVPQRRGNISGAVHVNDQAFLLKQYIFP